VSAKCDHPVESLECVGGPFDGQRMGIKACEVEITLGDGIYKRRQCVPFDKKSDPLWRLVKDVLDWTQTGYPAPGDTKNG
jgi:hypothetical protein